MKTFKLILILLLLTSFFSGAQAQEQKECTKLRDKIGQVLVDPVLPAYYASLLIEAKSKNCRQMANDVDAILTAAGFDNYVYRTYVAPDNPRP